jgi:mannonate dehydratase
MLQAWRWFGPDDPVSLDNVRQAGAVGVVSALHHMNQGQIWSEDELLKRRTEIEAGGLVWSVVESIGVGEDIKTRSGAYLAKIENYKQSIRNASRAGVKALCYNFMAITDWTRTQLNWPLPNGGTALRFDAVDFAAYDLFILRRENAEGDYDPDRVAAARERCEAMTYKDVTVEGLRANLIAFAREIAVVAEEEGVRLAIHPDDPAFPLFGLPRVMSTADDFRQLFAAVPSHANGMTLCAGSLGSNAQNDVVAMAKEFSPRVHFAHLRNVKREPDGSFFEADHLAGETDMVRLVAALMSEEDRRRAEGRADAEIPMRPDHGHLLGDDGKKRVNPGYSFIGRLKGLAELRGVMQTVEAFRSGRAA